MTGMFDLGLERGPANHQPMTPIRFLERAALVWPDHTAIIHGRIRRSYAEFWTRARRLASALASAGIGKGDTVSVMLANTPEMIECHFGVPMCGAVLHTINTRLDAAAVAFQLDHGDAKLVIVDREFSAVMAEALALAEVAPQVIDVDDSEYPADAATPQGRAIGRTDYEAFLASGDPAFDWLPPQDEWDAIALNYTSGTTGNPKGAVYHHRGATLMAYSNTVHAALGRHPVYLWTLPMFHCNGWCFPWTLALTGGTHVCLRWVRAGAIYEALADHKVTHLCGAPIVMQGLINASGEERRELPHAVNFNTAGAPPPASVIDGIEAMGFVVNHIYGLTETYGPSVVNEWKGDWDGKDRTERAELKSRQGVRYLPLDELAVLDPETMQPVPADGETLGEVMFRGNIVMKGYLKNPRATEEAFAGGWFHSGDLGVMHPDGYVQLKDRSKDIIISGGENISSIEVENVIFAHPAVMLAAVIAHPHPKWGETPVAYVELKPGAEAGKQDIIGWARQHLAHYKCPTDVVFCEIPRTSTGKLQKFRLREMAKGG
ncbi:AMP-binding protein [Paracoccus sp. S-4012]|uniref:acyl-CoA synthetase n=1 Tax=Paracoccus sp. S-4012 TaxID=2665648 RepID=UPI0012B0BD8F|nr:acyl-CoA synthetase [Paracoccus sp. S-4012]MRX50908.1 AMP-binding protein [Paracoccus sp. S-4012]